MPCESHGLEESSSAAWKESCDKVTSLLCRACRVLELANGVFNGVFPGELYEWWQQHKFMDAERAAQESLCRDRHRRSLEREIKELEKELGELRD